MQSNTVQTLIDYIKDITGLTNVSDAKVIRALNFGVDHYSYLRITSSNTWRWDSRNQTDLPTVTATLTTAGKLSLENEVIAIERVEILLNGKYQRLDPTDLKDNSTPLSTYYGDASTPKIYDYDTRHLYFYPVPDTSYTVRVIYSRAHPRFTTTNLTQSVGVEPIHEEYIALYAADKLMIGSNDPIRAQIRQDLVEKEAEIKDLAAKQDRDTTVRLKGKVPSVFMRRTRGNR